jgi:serine/threonine protein kinase
VKRKNELSSTYTGLDRKTQQRIIIKHSTHDEQYENSGIKIERLIVESDVLRSLKHPSIVKYVHSWGNKKDYYLITEYVDAKNMKETCENNAPPRDLTIEYILQLLEVAEYLHDKGIIHRDIKPSNIILSDTIILLDFNAAEAKRLNFEHNRIIIGTPGYQSPESYKGIESPQCDVYSVGATLLFLLTGEHPSGDLSHFKTLSQHKDLLEIALKAMDPDPE